MDLAFLNMIGQTMQRHQGEILKTGGIILGILVLAFIVVKIGDIIINQVFKPRESKLYFEEGRVLTLRTIAKSMLRYTVYFVVGFTVLDQVADLFKTTLKGFFAGAGILGLALGFGAQNLVKDIITGFFILLENQYAVGEYITTGTFSGFVEEMGLRSTKLKDWGGEYHYIPNGQITAVTNFSRGTMRALVDVAIAYDQDTDRAIQVMKKAAAALKLELPEVIVEGPDVLGIVALAPDSVTVRVVAKTKSMEQWRVEREIRRCFKEAFAREGIEMPNAPRIVMRSGSEDKAKPGDKAPLRDGGV